ncbi:hypothetical protein O3P69_011395 [Scylla paramamosain]|uniref:Uncharacterized protein n=1 Tax=Scylla paramamosain TaxID=85552 RepID=A0AAW0T7R5_SCYPA
MRGDRVSGADVTKDRSSPPTSQAVLSCPSRPSWILPLAPLPIQSSPGPSRLAPPHIFRPAPSCPTFRPLPLAFTFHRPPSFLCETQTAVACISHRDTRAPFPANCAASLMYVEPFSQDPPFTHLTPPLDLRHLHLLRVLEVLSTSNPMLAEVVVTVVVVVVVVVVDRLFLPLTPGDLPPHSGSHCVVRPAMSSFPSQWGGNTRAGEGGPLPTLDTRAQSAHVNRKETRRREKKGGKEVVWKEEVEDEGALQCQGKK